MSLTKVSSDFAILDVTKGRDELAKRLDNQPGKPPIPVVIFGEITNIWGSDDGTSQEFTVKVKFIKLSEPAQP
jgi:glutaredoxin